MSEGSRRALCIGVGSFTPVSADGDDEPDLMLFEDLDYAAEYTRELHAALREAGYDSDLGVDPAVLTAEELGGRVERHLAGGGVAVVHVLSHGVHTPNGGVYVVGSDEVWSKRTRVADWRIAVADDPSAPMTLFLLDLCHAGAANRHWQPPEPGAQERAWVIAATGADKPAYAGRLTRAATTVIHRITSGELDLAPTVRTVGFDVLFERIRKEVCTLALAEDGHPQDPMATPVMGAYPELPFFRNPRYQPHPAAEAAAAVEPATAPFLDPALDEEHFRDCAAGRGLAAGRITAGCFTGRAPQLQKLAAWMDGDGDSGVTVVTGSPGAGKSALLGLLVCAAHPGLRGATQDLWRTAAARPSENPELAAVHARQRALPVILRSLAAQLHLDPDLADGELTPAGVINAIARWAAPPVVVIDAVDEAPDHQQLVDQLLIPLARARRGDGTPACRLLVGMRPWQEFGPLLDLAHRIGEVVDLDRIPPEQRRRDVTDYITGLLELLPRYATATYRVGRRAFADAVAATLVNDETVTVRWGEFLVASLYTHTISLNSPDQLIDAAGAARLGASVPRTLPEVLELDLAARPAPRWRRAVLTALAHARGAGIPRSVLPAVAAAVAGQPVPLSLDQIAEELDALRFYLRTSADTDGSTLYRLFHQGLADHLRDGRDGDPAAVPGQVLGGLLATVPIAQGVRRWDLAEPYLLRHAVQHAADAGQVDELLADPGFLVHADPGTLIPALHLADSEQARLAAAVYRASAGVHPRRSPGQRRDVIAIDAARYGAKALLDRIVSSPDTSRSRWRPRWATGGQVSTALRTTLTGHPEPVAAVACTQLNGRPVAVTAGHDETVLIWDLTSGIPIGDPLTGHTRVKAVACTHLDGRPVAVTGGEDTTVRIWNLTTRTPIGSPLTGHTDTVHSVACTQLDGQPIAVTASGDGTVRVWNLITRTPIGDTLSDRTGLVKAVDCTRLGDRPVAVAGSSGGTVRIWDLTTGTPIGDPIGDPLTGHINVTSVACTQLDGRPVAVTGGWDGTVRVWDLTTGAAIGSPLTGHTDWVKAVACTQLDGRPVAVTAGSDGTVRIWNLTTHTPIGDPLTGHTGVNAVACTQLDGRPVAVTAGTDGSDGTVRIWNLTTGVPSGNSLTGHTSWVMAVACTHLHGRSIAVTAGHDTAVRIWNLTTGTPIGDPLNGHTWLDAVACTQLDGKPVAVAAGWDHTVRVWDLITGTPIGDPLTGHTDRVKAVACTQLDSQPIAVAASWDHTVRVWDLTTGTSIGDPLTGHTHNVEAAACIQLDGRPVAVTAGWDHTVRVWDLTTGTPVGDPLIGHTGWVDAVACIQLDGRPIALTASQDHTVGIWDLAAGTSIGDLLTSYTGTVRAVACTQIDGRPVAVTAGSDATVRIWDLKTRRQIDRIDLPGDVLAIDVTAAGEIVAAFGWDIVVLERQSDGKP